MNRITFLAATAVFALLSGCAGVKSFSGFEPATPADYTGATVNVADRVVALGAQRLNVFEMTQVDGRRLASSSVATTRAGQGSAMTVAPVALTNELPLQPARVRIQATTQYATPLVAVSNETCRTVGEVAFTPQEGKRYAVNGRIGTEACEVWIEDVATGQPVTDKVTGPGTRR